MRRPADWLSEYRVDVLPDDDPIFAQLQVPRGHEVSVTTRPMALPGVEESTRTWFIIRRSDYAGLGETSEYSVPDDRRVEPVDCPDDPICAACGQPIDGQYGPRWYGQHLIHSSKSGCIVALRAALARAQG